MHAARKTDAAPGHALPRNVAVQGLEVSLRHVLQDLLLQRQFGHQSPQTTVLLLQLLHPPCLFQPQSAVFLAPAIIGLFSYARFSAGLPGGLVVDIFGSAESAIHLDDSCGTGNNNTVIQNTITEACAGVLLGTGTGNIVRTNNVYNSVNHTTLAGDTCTAPAAATSKNRQ